MVPYKPNKTLVIMAVSFVNFKFSYFIEFCPISRLWKKYRKTLIINCWPSSTTWKPYTRIFSTTLAGEDQSTNFVQRTLLYTTQKSLFPIEVCSSLINLRKTLHLNEKFKHPAHSTRHLDVYLRRSLGFALSTFLIPLLVSIAEMNNHACEP